MEFSVQATSSEHRSSRRIQYIAAAIDPIIRRASNLTPLERLAGFDSLVISREQASAIEERIAGMRRSQPTGAHAEGFDEEQAVEPIDGEWHGSVIVEPNEGRIPGNAAFKEEAARFRASHT